MLNVKEYLDEMPKEKKDQLTKEHKEVLSELVRLQDKYEGHYLVKADLFQLGKDDKTFDITMQKLISKKGKPITVEIEYLIKMNMQWFNCGKIYVVDEKATDEFHTALEKHKKNLKENDELDKAAGLALKGALKGVSVKR